MLCLKKVFKDELLHLALILSLLRIDQNSYEEDIFNDSNGLDLIDGTTWRSTLTPTVIRNNYVNPKSFDSILLNYERELFADLNSLGRYNRDSYRYPEVHTYLLNIEKNSNTLNNESLATREQNGTQENLSSPSNIMHNDMGLSQEDMHLIEDLWKQDVDLGYTLEDAAEQEEVLKEKTSEFLKETADPTTSLCKQEKDENFKEINNEKIKKEKIENDGDEEEVDIWAGLDYTVDTETGEYVLKEETGPDPLTEEPTGGLALPQYLLDEALRLVELDDNDAQIISDLYPEDTSAVLPGIDEFESKDKLIGNADADDFDLFQDMIQTPQFPHPHHRAAYQSRMPFMRTVSMEQRWQDLANLLSLPNSEHHPFGPHSALHNYSHPHTHAHPATAYTPDTRGVLLHNATLPTPMPDMNSTVPYGGTIGNALATSMNLTNSSEPMGEPSSAAHYKLDGSSDMMYYQNTTGSEFTHNQTDGFLSGILNDEDLQLMDMAMNEGMYTMRMLESNNTVGMNNTAAGATSSVSRNDMERVDTSSDSAVSSMGSERVPSLSDGEWCDGGSDSGHTNGEHYPHGDYHNKFRPYDYSYSNRQLPENNRMPVAQKKHQMYGKRYFQDQGHQAAAANAIPPHPHTPVKYEYRDPMNNTYCRTSQPDNPARTKIPEMKYSCSVEFNHVARTPLDHVQHNHTYNLPAESAVAMQRPISRDKTKSRKSEEEHLTRDEKRARALSIPISVDDVINLPMDEFNERLSKFELTEAQLSLIRDIRRRGKNKVAAQNCRKRKLDQILSLADEVKEMRDRKLKLIDDHKYAKVELQRMKDKYQQLYRHVFQNLRDSEGNQYSPYQYSLQTAADGSILMVPRSNATLSNSNSITERKEPPHSSQKD